MLDRLDAAHSKELNPFELRLALVTWILLGAALVFPTLVRLVVAGVWWTPDFTAFLRVVGMDPMNASGFASIFILFLGARPHRKLLIGTSVLGLLLEIYYVTSFLPAEMSGFTKALSSGGGFAAAGFLGLLVQAFFFSSPVAKKRASIFLRIALVLMLYPYTTAAMMGALSHLTPMVYDSHAYLLEGSLGFWPSFEVARFLALNPGLEAFFTTIYSRLPIWVALALLANIIYSQRCYFNVLTAYVLSGVGAIFFYLLIPLVGIDDYLGSTFWPLGPLPETVKPILHRAGAELPRSCLPSMHGCWILLPFFCVRRISPKFAWVYGFLVVTTLISAMRAVVGHYSIDFVASVPYALAIQAMTARSSATNWKWRVSGVSFGLGTTLLCALAVRWYGVGLAQVPLFSWSAMAVIVVISLILEHKLSVATLEDEPPADE